MLDLVRCLQCHVALGIAMLQQQGTHWRDRATVVGERVARPLVLWAGQIRFLLVLAFVVCLFLRDDPLPLLLILPLLLGAKFRARSVSCVRAPESATATSRLPCCTTEEADHPVLKENAMRKGEKIGWLRA